MGDTILEGAPAGHNLITKQTHSFSNTSQHRDGLPACVCLVLLTSMSTHPPEAPADKCRRPSVGFQMNPEAASASGIMT